MPQDAFPFPNIELAYKELSYDLCFAKIPVEDREKIVHSAWQKGKKAAESILKKHNGETSFFKLAEECGLQCEEQDRDCVIGNRRYFSDYLSGQNKIILYLKSIALWAEQNNLTISTAKNMILGHEFFHFLEYTKIGLTSREYMVPAVSIGSFKFGKTGVRALSEIGAHAFVRTYFELLQNREA